MKIKIILVILTLQFADLQSQPCGFYDKQTNTFHNCFGNSVFINNNPLPPLFNWEVVYPWIYNTLDIYFADSLYGWATDANGGFLKTTDSGFNWQRTQIVNGTGDLCGVHFINRDTGWICGIMGLIRKTTNNGADWTILDTMESFNWSVYFMNYDTGYISGLKNNGHGYIIKTTNSGETWSQIYQADSSNSDIVGQKWVNETTGWFCGYKVLIKTTNEGTNYTSYLPTTSNGYNFIFGISFINEQTGWISGYNDDHKNLYKTTNSGINWVFQDNPIVPYQYPQLNDVIFINEDTGWAAAYVGQIIVTTNSGTNWLTDLNSNNSFWCFSNHVSTKLWCGAVGEIWYLDNLPALGIEVVHNQIPCELVLKQNYPNPFNSVTIIEFDIPKKSNVTLKIYDILGREIKKLLDSELNPGTYKINYSPENLTSSVYFYVLETENFKAIRKLVLVK